ncbi:tetratricopeptide repeat protein, partial [bacterium]|nr:tetratricopeptide repeat protein [bacterium]
ISFVPVKAFSVAILLLVGILTVLQVNSPSVNSPSVKIIEKTDQIENINIAARSSNYLTGRELLTKGEYNKSIGFLKKAVALNPEDSEYHFWLGVNYGNLKEYQSERASYLKAIALKPDHLMSNYFLGHSFMDEQNWDMALKAYDRTLSIQPAFEQALYNRGIALQHIGSYKEETDAWKSYLAVKNTGLWALRAAEHLNASGDFSYRTCQIGRRKMVIGPFLNNVVDQKAVLSDSSLNSLGNALNLSKDLDLHVIVYLDNNQLTAERQAKKIKKQLVENFSKINSARIKLSWFGVGEKVTIGDKSFSLEHSVRFLGLIKQHKYKGVST